MRIWLSCFFVLFALAELYQWAKHLSLPLPIYILGGAFLAIASNYNKLNGWAWQIPFFHRSTLNSGNKLSNVGDTAHLPSQTISLSSNSQGQIEPSEQK